MYGIKAAEIRTRLNLLFDRFKTKSEHESLVELWAIVSDIQCWLADQEELAEKKKLQS